MDESCMICLNSNGSLNSEKNIIDWRNALNDKKILIKVFELTKTDFISCSLCNNCYRIVSTIGELENELVTILNTARTGQIIKHEDITDEDAIEIVPLNAARNEQIIKSEDNDEDAIEIVPYGANGKEVDVPNEYDLDMLLGLKDELPSENGPIKLVQESFKLSIDELDQNLKITEFPGNYETENKDDKFKLSIDELDKNLKITEFPEDKDTTENEDELMLPSPETTVQTNDDNNEKDKKETVDNNENINKEAENVEKLPGYFKLVCNSCGKRGRDTKNFELHKKLLGKLHDGKCVHCKEEFENWLDHKNHVISEHDGKFKHKCGFCEKYFDKSHSLKIHINRYCDKAMEELDDMKKICEDCGKIFFRNALYREHRKRVHLNVGEYPCETCGVAMKTEKSLKEHIINCHKEPVTCEVCGLNLRSPSLFRIHKFNHHTKDEDKPYRCEFCQKGFAGNYALQQHRNTHTGDRPFKCDKCEKAYPDGSTLRQHKVATHEGGKIKKHKAEKGPIKV